MRVSPQVFVFGGMTMDGQLLDDMWTLELDSMQWNQLHTFGTPPCARKGRATDSSLVPVV